MEGRYPEYKMKVTSVHYPWAARHAGWLLTRYVIKTDGKTPYEHIWAPTRQGIQRRSSRMLRGSPLQTGRQPTRKVGRTKCNRCVAWEKPTVWWALHRHNRRHHAVPVNLEKAGKQEVEFGTPWQDEGFTMAASRCANGNAWHSRRCGSPRYSWEATIGLYNLGPPNPSRTHTRMSRMFLQCGRSEAAQQECGARFEELIGQEKSEAARKSSQQQEMEVEMPGGIFDNGDELQDVQQERGVRRKITTTADSAGVTTTQSAASTADGSAGGPEPRFSGWPREPRDRGQHRILNPAASRGKAGGTVGKEKQANASTG